MSSIENCRLTSGYRVEVRLGSTHPNQVSLQIPPLAECRHMRTGWKFGGLFTLSDPAAQKPAV